MIHRIQKHIYISIFLAPISANNIFVNATLKMIFGNIVIFFFFKFTNHYILQQHHFGKARVYRQQIWHRQIMPNSGWHIFIRLKIRY